MALVNRVIAAITEMVLIFGAAVVLVATFGVPGYRVLPYGWFGGYLSVLDGLSGFRTALVITFSVATIVVSLVLLVLQRPRVRRQRPYLVTEDEAGLVTIEPASIRLLCENVGAEVRGVRELRCSIRRRPGGLVITCLPVVTLGADVPRIAEEMQGKVKESVESLVGLAVHQVRVAARYERARERTLALE